MAWRTRRSNRGRTHIQVCLLAPFSSPASRPCTWGPLLPGASFRKTFSQRSTFGTVGTRSEPVPGCLRTRNKKRPHRRLTPFPPLLKEHKCLLREPIDCRLLCPIVDDAEPRSHRLGLLPGSCPLAELCQRIPWICLRPGPGELVSGWELDQIRWSIGRIVASRRMNGPGRLLLRCTRCHRASPGLRFAHQVALDPAASRNRPPFAPSFCPGSNLRISPLTMILKEESGWLENVKFLERFLPRFFRKIFYW